ncbi:MAG: hypothetical protein C5B43_01565 [Verrucomicrobia bacterium]|nr:MAG: hypothetical protein C5B43_01565 [Verrucomicrobiota bacterium]
MGLSNEEKIRLLKLMLTSRAGDLREQRMIRQGKGWFHVSGMGHESMGAIGLLMEEGDYCFPFYRDRALVLSRGITSYDLALTFYAKKESSSGGRQLPAHYSNRKLNIWSHLSPIAAHWLPACGAAWGLKLDGKQGKVVVATVGDGGSRQGDFFEAICFAKEHNLPVIFVVEDNGFAISTKTDRMNAMALKELNEDEWVLVDGSNPQEVYEKAKEAFEKVRHGKGPAFIWSKVERLSSHSSADDQRNYRSEEEITKMGLRDAVTRFKNDLIKEKVLSQEQINEIEQEIEITVRDAYTKAESAADPQPGDEKKNVFGSIGIGKAPTLTAGEKYRMADAINFTFKDALSTNKDVCFFGEDVEDPLGGVFKLTKGLSSEFPGRVVNSPLAESTILGVACGLASYGKRPIFEIQFVDFIGPALNQLFNNIALLRWRSNGDWTCPAIIYAPCGGYLPGGAIWHSQTNESAFAHFPGLLIVMPSTPEDASGLLLSALASEEPVLFLIPKHLLWAPRELPAKLGPIPIGKAAVRHEGSDLTVVAWGNCTEVVESALSKLDNGAGIEYIDLRSIVPWDKETIIHSVSKTRRLVIVQEDTINCSVGQMIITTLMEDHVIWNSMIAPPVLVSKGNVHIGFNPVLEYSSLPDVERVIKAINKTLAVSSARTPMAASEMPTELKEVQMAGFAQKGHKIIRLPNLGEGLREARMIEIFKKEGEKVSEDDPLCEVETDKAIFPVESSVEGIIGKWLVKEDDIIQVGQEIAEIIITGEGHGANKPHEEIQKADDGHITEKGALSSEIIKQLSGVLPASLGVVAEWEGVRKAWSSVRGRSKSGAFSYTTLVAWAVVKALEEFPAFRRLLQNGQVTEPQKDFDIGFAVALENDELETAVIPKANTLNWADFVKAYREGLNKVKEGVSQSKARTSLLLTSMGPLKIRTGNPIVVPPALCTLFLGEPYFETRDNGEVKEVVALDFSFDHRWANGAGAGRFLKQIKDNIEKFDESILKE